MATGSTNEGSALALPGLTMEAMKPAGIDLRARTSMPQVDDDDSPAAPRPRGAPAARRRGQQGRRAQITSRARSGAAAARTLDVIEHVVTLASAMIGEALFGWRLLAHDDVRAHKREANV